MTVKLKSGEERLKKPNKRLQEAEEEEEAAAVEGEDNDKCKKEGEKTLSELPRQDPKPALTPPAEPCSVQQDQRHFLRSSVRPHTKRQRRDSCGDGPGTSTKNKGLDNATPSSPSCSTGLAPSTPKTQSRNLATPAGEKEEGNKKKVRRQWESWSTEDKNTFFEALYEHGKDFEAIQNNIALKYKKKAKPASMVKNKEQVRHFYYRTWHKISKYIDFNNEFCRGIKKSSQELYGLICYGELRKKIGGCMDDKNATKLNELIQLGLTTVRYKGRNLRIKAPMCRALKKLCDPDGKTGLSDDEDQKPVRLPLKVPVELQPRNNQAWTRVQSLAQNPRLRMIVELHRKVSCLIEFLKQKWALQEDRIRKSLDDHQLKDVASQDLEEELFLFPPEAAQMSTLPGVARVVHSKAFCTVHWQETGKCRQSLRDTHLLPPAQILGIQTGLGTARVQLKCPKGVADAKQGSKVNGVTDTQSDSAQAAEDSTVDNILSAGVSTSPQSPDEPPPERMDSPPIVPVEVSSSIQPDVEELSLLDPFPRYLKSCRDLILPEENNCTEKTQENSPISPKVLSASTIEPSPSQEQTEMQTSNIQTDNCTTEISGTDSQEKEQSSPSKPSPDNANQLIEQLRQEGWNQRTSENLTLAEVYLMLGKPGKLQLEYEWLAPSTPDGSSHTPCHKQRLLNCLLRLIATEMNHRNSLQVPETTSVATSPMKLPAQDLSLTPPGKVITLSRNPSCLQTQPAPQIHSHFPPTCSTSGYRNLPRPLLVGSPLGPVAGTSDGGVFAVPTMRPPNSRHTKISSPGKESENPVRRPLDTLSSEFFLPKSKKPRSRHPRKPLVVQRTLLPRPSGSSSPHVCSFSILSNSSVAGRGSFRPIHSSLGRTAVSHVIPKGLTTTSPLSSAIDLAAQTAGIIPDGSLPVVETDVLTGIPPLPPDGLSGAAQNVPSQDTSVDSIPTVTVCAENPIPFISLSTPPVQSSRPFQPSSVLSLPELSQNPLHNDSSNMPNRTTGSAGSCLLPPNVSALLDISLPGPPDDVLSQGGTSTHISDSIIEIAISSGQFGEAVPLSPAKLNESSKSLPSPNSSPRQNWIASPSHDPQWYPNDSTDSSLSSLFSSFISPEKSRKTSLAAQGSTSGTSLLGPSLLDGNSRDSFVSRSIGDVAEVVDSQLACLMNENSIDYISRFNDLAQELSSGAPGSGQPIRDLS
ncbi:hypothetical protein GDO86_017438 [Hymenochirus boettgeri]|nr:hypothetical protein GDO86_017438 [Hymenochirus boettgeri]